MKATLLEQLLVGEQTLYNIFDALLGICPLLESIIIYHRDVFTSCYDDCSKGKEKYLRFQLEWHNLCSVFLLSKKYETCSILNSSSVQVDELREQWLTFCDNYDFESCCRVMIMLTSSIYEMFLKQIHLTIKCQGNSVVPQSSSSDGDDVYYRFGGAVLCDMLHKRYKIIKTCATSRKCQVLQEIEILQSMNDKEKEELPEYLKYRDRGFMYATVKESIPFFREVDNCVRETVNEAGFREHGGKLVTVSSFMEYKMFIFHVSGCSFND